MPASVLKLLAELGDNFRDSVSAFTPMDDYSGLINHELGNKFRDFWRAFSGKTSSIFQCRLPLQRFDPKKDDWIFFPITDEIITDDAKARQFFRELHRVYSEIIAHRYGQAPDPRGTNMSVFQTLYDSVQLKLPFMGAGIDIKPILSRVAQWRRRR